MRESEGIICQWLVINGPHSVEDLERRLGCPYSDFTLELAALIQSKIVRMIRRKGSKTYYYHFSSMS